MKNKAFHSLIKKKKMQFIERWNDSLVIKSKYPRYTAVKTNSSNRGIRYVYLGEFAESGALPQALNASVPK